MQPKIDPRFDITVRVGCSLVYEVTGTASLLLNLKLRPDHNHVVLSEALSLGNNLPADEFIDSHGNGVCRVTLAPGTNCFRHDAIVAAPSQPDNYNLVATVPQTPGDLPPNYCATHYPAGIAIRTNSPISRGASSEISNMECRVSRRSAAGCTTTLSIDTCRAGPISRRPMFLQRGYGVCRDFAHLAIALNRTFNLPARYVTGHLPDVGFPDPENHMDFHAYAEVYIGGNWFTTDARFHVPRIGRIKVSCGQDAVDGAFSTIFGGATLTYFQVWAYQVARGTVGIGDPLDLSKRLDNQWAILTDTTSNVQ